MHPNLELTQIEFNTKNFTFTAWFECKTGETLRIDVTHTQARWLTTNAKLDAKPTCYNEETNCLYWMSNA